MQTPPIFTTGSAVSITEEDRLRTTQSKTTNLSAEHFFGDLDNAIRRKGNASLRQFSRTVESLLQRYKACCNGTTY
jgi:hypothetical protein